MEKSVKDVMSTNIIAVLPSDTAAEAARLMKEHNIGVVPVVSAGKIQGVITDRDIALRCVAGAKDPSKTKASDIMTTQISCVSPDQTINDAINMMSKEQVSRLPVVNCGCIDGIVSFADVAKCGCTDVEIAKAICESCTLDK